MRKIIAIGIIVLSQVAFASCSEGTQSTESSIDQSQNQVAKVVNVDVVEF